MHEEPHLSLKSNGNAALILIYKMIWRGWFEIGLRVRILFYVAKTAYLTYVMNASQLLVRRTHAQSSNLVFLYPSRLTRQPN